MYDVGVGLNISENIMFTMMEKLFMFMGEVYLGFRPDPLSPIIQVLLVYRWGFIVMLMREVYISLRPEQILHITMVEYTFPTQGFLDNLFQGVWK